MMKWSDFVLKVLGTHALAGDEKRVLLAVVALLRDRHRAAMTQSEIGAVIGMNQPSVSAKLAELVRSGFLVTLPAKPGNSKFYGTGKKLELFASDARKIEMQSAQTIQKIAKEALANGNESPLVALMEALINHFGPAEVNSVFSTVAGDLYPSRY